MFEVRAHLKEMETLGAIRKSQSPYASNVVIVCKKSGALRFCIDLRAINRKTIPDRYSLPWTQHWMFYLGLSGLVYWT